MKARLEQVKIFNAVSFSLTKNLKKLYYVICGEYRKFEKPNISYLLEKALVLSIICSKCKNEDEESIEILKILNFN